MKIIYIQQLFLIIGITALSLSFIFEFNTVIKKILFLVISLCILITYFIITWRIIKGERNAIKSKEVKG